MSSALPSILLFSALLTLSLCGTPQFHVIKENKTWANAQKYCREHFTDLATISNQEEMNTIIDKLNGATGHFWIGLKPQSQNNITTWVWSDGSNASYRYWFTNQPSISLSDICAELRSENAYKWTVIDCQLLHQFVCYKDIPLILIKENKTWWEALRYCRDNHMDLVSVHTEEIQHWVDNVTETVSTANVWVGLRHICEQKFWFWVSGSIICYQNWAPGNGTGEDCNVGSRSGAVNSGSKQWVSLPENHKLSFICTIFSVE